MDSTDHLHSRSNFGSEAAAVSLILTLQAPRVKVQEVPHGTNVALFRSLINVCTSGRHTPELMEWTLNSQSL